MSLSFTGKFISENALKIKSEGWFVALRGWSIKKAYLNGSLYPQNGKAIVRFTVEPSMFWIFLFLPFYFVDILCLFKCNQEYETVGDIFGLFSIGVLMPMAVIILSGYFSKKAIKNAFVSALKLKPLE